MASNRAQYRTPLPELRTPPLPTERGNCYGIGDAMYPAGLDHHTGQRASKRAVALARRICDGCIIEEWCRQASKYEPDGVWAATVPSERARDLPGGVFPTRHHLQLVQLSGDHPNMSAVDMALFWEIGASPESGARQVREVRRG